MSAIDAIEEPVRLATVRHLERAGSATLIDVAFAAGVHVNTARSHLAALERAGVVRRCESSGGGPGRPPIRYRLADGWTATGASFRGLAELLAAAVAETGVEPAALRRLGRDWGRYLLGRPGRAAAAPALGGALAELGFAAELGDGWLALRSCPCAMVAPRQPQMVCELAVGAAEGVLAGCGQTVVAGERRHDPARRSCRVQLEPLPIHDQEGMR